MAKSVWSQRKVDKVVPKRYPSGRPIPPEVRREIYAYYLLEKKLQQLKRAESLRRRSQVKKLTKKKKLKKVM